MPAPYRDGAHIITKLTQGTMAERLLKTDDEVFEVQGTNVTNTSHQSFIALIKNAELTLKLVVCHYTAGTTSARPPTASTHEAASAGAGGDDNEAEDLWNHAQKIVGGGNAGNAAPTYDDGMAAAFNASEAYDGAAGREATAKDMFSRVTVAGYDGVEGVLVYFGSHKKFKPGKWVGVHLHKAVGDSDGTFDGKEYFQCDANCGVLASPEDVSVLTADATTRQLFLRKKAGEQSFGFDLVGPDPPLNGAGSRLSVSSFSQMQKTVHVINTVPNGPAARCGLVVGDRIAAVNGEDLPADDPEIDVQSVVNKIKQGSGPDGVRLTVRYDARGMLQQRQSLSFRQKDQHGR